jgi:redox-sensing transcriptional repressor
MNNSRSVSRPTIKRLPSYLYVIEAARNEGKQFISGTVIAEELGLEPIQVRKDIASTGIIGKPRVGFNVDELMDTICSFLRWNQENKAILLGVGHLGAALVGYQEFRRRGLTISAAFDTDPDKLNNSICDTPILPLKEMHTYVQKHTPDIAILTVPSSVAQETADAVVAAGIQAVWNFTNVKLKLPPHILVQKEDLSSGYAMLSVKLGLQRTPTPQA